MFQPSPRFFEVAPIKPSWRTNWGTPQPVTSYPKPSYADNEELKKLFGVELAKDHPNNLAAAIVVFGEDTNAALWASVNWLTDPIVLGARDAYRKTAEANASLLDKDGLAVKLLKFADEKDQHGRYVCDAKDRVAALKLYSEVMGFTGRIDINASTNNFTHNEMKIKFVTSKVKEHVKIIESEDTICGGETEDNINPLPINLKLISGTG